MDEQLLNILTRTLVEFRKHKGHSAGKIIAMALQMGWEQGQQDARAAAPALYVAAEPAD